MELMDHSFSSGKPQALVIDIGANTTSVTPIWDGFVLKKGVQKSSLGGNFISEQIRRQFAQMTPPVPLVPHYTVKTKQPVDAGSSSNATYVQFATPPSESFRRLEEERVLTSFKESMVQVWQGPGRLETTEGMSQHQNLEAVKAQPPRPFEMPDGWNQVFGVERFKVAEGLFDANAAIKVHRTLVESFNAVLTALPGWIIVRPRTKTNHSRYGQSGVGCSRCRN